MVRKQSKRLHAHGKYVEMPGSQLCCGLLLIFIFDAIRLIFSCCSFVFFDSVAALFFDFFFFFDWLSFCMKIFYVWLIF